jgi:hypothetical protein
MWCFWRVVGLWMGISLLMLSVCPPSHGKWNWKLTITGTNCASKLSSTTTTSSSWIAAWNLGSAIDSTDDSYYLNQHSTENHEQFTFDLTSATISSDTNPFISSSTNGTSTASTSVPTETGTSSGSSTISQTNIFDYEKAHGIIMGVTVVLLFPIGALFMRLFGSALLHAALQIFSLIALVVGFGLGIKLAKLKFYVRLLSIFPYSSLLSFPPSFLNLLIST